MWLHVDAAYGGGLALLPEAAAIREGWADADSFVINPHKMLFVPFDFSALYVREIARLRRVFALTLVPDFFTKCGFTLTSLGRLPEKSASECPVCPKRFACDEHAMLLHLDGSTPPGLTPGEPVGYTRLFLHTEPS